MRNSFCACFTTVARGDSERYVIVTRLVAVTLNVSGHELSFSTSLFHTRRQITNVKLENSLERTFGIEKLREPRE